MSIMIHDKELQVYKDITNIIKINDSILSDCEKVLTYNNEIWEEKWTKKTDLIVTRDVLNSGSFLNVTPTYLTNQINGSDGFRITGAAKNTFGYINGYSGYYDNSSYLRWDISLDLTNYSKITFHARQIAKHGIMYVYISDGLKYDANYNSSYATVLYGGIGRGYNDFSTAWTEYTVDLSNITGTHIVSFIGGYTDQSGNATSATEYCNIKFCV